MIDVLLDTRKCLAQICDFGLARIRHSTWVSGKSQGGTPEVSPEFKFSITGLFQLCVTAYLIISQHKFLACPFVIILLWVLSTSSVKPETGGGLPYVYFSLLEYVVLHHHVVIYDAANPDS